MEDEKFKDANVVVESSVDDASATGSSDRYQQAYERQLPVFSAIPNEKLVTLGVKLPETHVVVGRALPRVHQHAAAIEALVPHETWMIIQSLEERDLAMVQAQINYEVAANEPAADAPVEEANRLRDGMVSELKVLVKFGHLAPEQVDGFCADRSHRTLVFDIIGCVALYRQLAAKKPDVKVQASPAMQSRAMELATKIDKAVLEREERPARIATAALLRNQAFTSMMEAYDEVRRALRYVRYHEEDAEEIAPSVFQARGRRAAAAKAAASSAATAQEAATGPASVSASVSVSASSTEPAKDAASSSAPASGFGELDSTPFDR